MIKTLPELFKIWAGFTELNSTISQNENERENKIKNYWGNFTWRPREQNSGWRSVYNWLQSNAVKIIDNNQMEQIIHIISYVENVSYILFMICYLWYAAYYIQNVKWNFIKISSFSGNRTDYSRMVYQNDNCDWAWKNWVWKRKKNWWHCATLSRSRQVTLRRDLP